MNRQEIEAKIKELQAQLDALPWRAEWNKIYWYVGSTGSVAWTHDIRHAIDNFRFETSNYFRTEEEALKEARLREFEQRVAFRFKELGGGVFISLGNNYTIQVDVEYSDVRINTWCSSYQMQRGWVAQDESVVKQIIGEFDFLAYARGEL